MPELGALPSSVITVKQQQASIISMNSQAFECHECKLRTFHIFQPFLRLNALQLLEWAFGKRMTTAERLRKHQRALEKTQRELDRERVKLENQEKKLVQDIKKSAKNGQIGACKIQAKDLVRTRRYSCSKWPQTFMRI